MTKLRKSVPPNVAAAVAKALEKLPADRFATAHGVRRGAAGRGRRCLGGTATRTRRGARPAAVGWRARLRDPLVLVPTLVAVAALAVAIGLARRTEAPALPPIRFVLAATDSTRPSDNFPWPAAISPDGGTVVYSVGAERDQHDAVPAPHRPAGGRIRFRARRTPISRTSLPTAAGSPSREEARNARCGSTAARR